MTIWVTISVKILKGQTTDAVKRKLESLFIKLVAVPANKTKFVSFYSTIFQKELQSGGN